MRPDPWSRLIALAIGAALPLAACSSCKSDAAPTVTAASDPDRVLPRGAPAKSPVVTLTNRTVNVNGRERTYLEVLPRDLDPSPWLVLVLHGDGGSAASFHQGFPYEVGSGNKAVLAYPDGIGSTWDLETLDDNKDEAFTLALIDTLTKEHKIDPAHVYATGYSSGGFFINVFACHRPGVLRAIASSAAGAPYNQKEKWPNGYPGCPGQKATAMMAMHGTMDFGVTLKSGKFSAQYWAYVNGCNMHEEETTAYKQCVAYRECPARAPAVFCEIDGLGHWVWDDAASASFSFFSALDKAK